MACFKFVGSIVGSIMYCQFFHDNLIQNLDKVTNENFQDGNAFDLNTYFEIGREHRASIRGCSVVAEQG